MRNLHFAWYMNTFQQCKWFTRAHQQLELLVLILYPVFIASVMCPVCMCVCVRHGLITWARGQQPYFVKAFRQEYSGGHRELSGQMFSSPSPLYALIILKDCRDTVGNGNNLTSGLKCLTFLLSILSQTLQMSVILTLESIGLSADALSTQGMDNVAFTQLDVAMSQIVSAGQQCMWSSQHSAYEDSSSSSNTLTTKVLKPISHLLNKDRPFIRPIK